MTVETTTTIAGPYPTNGVATAFPFSFRALSADEVQVVREVGSVEATVSPSLYKVQLSAQSGTVVFDAPPAAGANIYVLSDPDFKQNISFSNQSAFLPSSHNEANDRSAIRAQVLAEQVKRAPVLPLDPSKAAGLFPKVMADGSWGYEAAGPGATGPSNNTRLSRAAIEKAAKTDKTSLYDNDLWVFQDGDLSALVTLDTYGGVYIAGSADLTGKTGAWVRSYKGPAKPEWFGAARNAGWDKDARVVTGADDTAAIQRALRVCQWVELDEGGYVVDAKVGIKVRSGMRITGKGRNKSFLIAKAGGGTIAQLEALLQGSVIKRDDFNRAAVVPGSNPYVTGCYFGDFGIVLTHPYDAITLTDMQIGLDLRHIRDSTAERIFIGNCTLPPFPIQKDYPADRRYFIQGYGFVCGNVSASDPAYSGGEANTIRLCHPWELYKNIVIDDVQLSPASAAYHTVVENCDIQGGHALLAQYGQYGALNTFYSNVLQNAYRRPDLDLTQEEIDSGIIPRQKATALYLIEGYESRVIPGYIETGSAVDYILYLADTSKRNVIDLGGYTAKAGGRITDLGLDNRVDYHLNGGDYPGGNASTGAPQRLINRIADPGPQLPVNVGQGEQIATDARVVPLTGNGAVRTEVTLQNGRYLGQRLILTGNSWGVRFASGAAIWSNDGPPEVGGGDQQVAAIQLVWTTSGWTELGRNYRPSTRVPLRLGSGEIGGYDANGITLAAGKEYRVNGQRVVSGRQAAIADVAAGGTVDTNARVTINAILSAMRAHGLISQ